MSVREVRGITIYVCVTYEWMTNVRNELVGSTEWQISTKDHLALSRRSHFLRDTEGQSGSTLNSHQVKHCH